jgi:hypothetical protein
MGPSIGVVYAETSLRVYGLWISSLNINRCLSSAASRGSIYRRGRSPHWVKVKNPKAPAVRREAEEDWGR